MQITPSRIFLIAIFLLAGCTPTIDRRFIKPSQSAQSPATRPGEMTPVPPPLQYAPLPESQIERPEYVLAPGDRLAVRFLPKVREAAAVDYRLRPGDQIAVRFPFEERYNQEVAVQPDGQVRLVLIGSVRAAGLTLEQLNEQLRIGYGRYIREPELTVDFRAADPRGAEIRKALVGDARQTPVKPDGTIDLPYLGEIHAAGLTVKALRDKLAERCDHEGLEEIDVSVQIEAFAPQQVFVTGEVASPGALTLTAPTTLRQAIAARGGLTTHANGLQVTLTRGKGLRAPDTIVVDVLRMVDEFADGRPPRLRFDPWLADGDIIHVPPSESDTRP